MIAGGGQLPREFDDNVGDRTERYSFARARAAARARRIHTPLTSRIAWAASRIASMIA
jgi:hypothetical protein